jgi:hypothetical protein
VIVDVDDTLCDVSEIRHLYAVPDDYREFTVASRDCLPRREVPDWCRQPISIVEAAQEFYCPTL